MPATDWPNSYGFSISGNGPCFVISVSREGQAYRAGISPGDQLLEVDGHNVTDMSSDAIKTLARHSSSQPPALGVVSRLQYINLVADRKWGYGLTVRGARPTVVSSVDPPGPAYQAGIRPGDIILEVNGKELKHFKYLEPILETKYGKIGLAVVPMEGKPPQEKLINDKGYRRYHQDSGASKSSGRVRKARDLFSKMNVQLGPLFEKKMTIVGLLKQYAEDRKIEEFATALNSILTTHQQRKLLEDIRPFVPMKQRTRFDQILLYRPPSNLSGSLEGLPHHFNTLRIRTGGDYHSNRATVVQRSSSERNGAGLLAIARRQDLQKARTVIVERASGSGSFGFVLRGHSPVCIESTVPRGPADKTGLKADDQILKVNGIDVSKCSHNHLVKILQSSGEVPQLEVIRNLTQISPIKQVKLPTRGTISSPDSHQTASSWLSDSGLTLDGYSFRDKVDMLLTPKEQMSLRLALIEYNMSRNIAQLVDDGNSILDTPSKRALWVFILHRMTRDHQNYVFKYVNIPKRYMQDVMNNVSKFSNDDTEEFMKSPNFTPDMLSSSDTLGVEVEKVFTKTGYHDKSKTDSLNSRNFHQGSFKQQLEYLLTSRERSQLKRAIQIYKDRKHVHHLLGDLSDILDTASKRTLWFYITPMLDEPHRVYVHKVLGLPSNRQSPPGKSHGPAHSPSKDVFPKYGDILYLQNEFVGKFLRTRKNKGKDSSDDEDLDDLVPANDGSVTSDLDQHTPSIISSENAYGQSVPAKKTVPIRTRFGKNRPVKTYSSDVEQSTMVLNPIYAEIDHSVKSSPTKNNTSTGNARPPKTFTKMVRESAAQTTPYSTPIHKGERDHIYPNHSSHPDFKTIVKVYDGAHGRNPDIVNVCDVRSRLDNYHDGQKHEDYYEEPVKQRASSGIDYTNIDNIIISPEKRLKENYYHSLELPNKQNEKKMQSRAANATLVTADVHNSDDKRNNPSAHFSGRSNGFRNGSTNILSHSGSIASHANVGNMPIQTIDNFRSASKLHSQMLSQSHSSEHSDFIDHLKIHSQDRNSAEGADSSFHTRAMDAIQILDDVVDNESDGGDFSEPENEEFSNHNNRYRSKQYHAEPPLPPPLPPPPSGNRGDGKSSVRLNIKRINWEKIDQPLENTIWAKIDRDSDDLQDIVKYLELEQQFSTKSNRVSQSFVDRKTENYILSPKKAYNISILLGHLKMSVSSVRQALLTINEAVLNGELLRQIITYLPDSKELEKYNNFSGAVEDMSKPDHFMYELSRLPGYDQRLKAMLFKSNFSEKVEELQKNISCMKMASQELQTSTKLSKVLELALAMGNYLNKGNTRVGKAAAFRLHFLKDIELTKTSDGKGSFLSVLVKAIHKRHKEMVHINNDLPNLNNAAKVSHESIHAEINELRKVLQEISKSVSDLSGQTVNSDDRFHRVMENFISQASDEIQGVFRSQQHLSEELHHMIIYFGEDPKVLDASDIFNIFAEFVNKYENASQQLLLP